MSEETASATVVPRVPKGFRDGMPGEVLLRNRMIDTVRAVVERYGFSPLETPAVERLDVLLGKYGEEGSKSIFRFQTEDGEDVGLRFDLTVPLARVVAQYPELPRPFRRYQVSPVWRFDKPGPGRFREFLQFDIDTVGSSSTAADVEVLAAMLEAFAALGVPRARFRVSSRALLNALVRFAGVPEARGPEVFRVLDKLEKLGTEAVKLELGEGRVDASGAPIRGLGLDRAQIGKIEGFLSISGKGRLDTLAAVESLLVGVDGAAAAVAELQEMHGQLDALGHGDERVAFDVALARGLDYYTGPIFEAVLVDAPEFGSVFGGGRYDGLVERFLGEKIAGTGGSLGVSRLLDALLHLGALQARKSAVDVLVTVLDRSLMREYLKIASELRAAGIACEVYLGDQRGLKKQFAHADRVGAAVAVVVGPDEIARGEVALKDLVAGAQAAAAGAGGAGDAAADRRQYLEKRLAQRSVARADLVAAVREMLAAGR